MPDEIIQTTSSALCPEIITPPIEASQDIKTYPTREEVEKITREIAKEEGFKIKDSLSTNSVTVLGIFASFIAFLTIEVQILKTVCDYSRILGFSMFILGAVLLFVSFIIYFTDSQNKKITHIVLLSLVSLTILVGGVIFISKGSDEYVCKLNRLNSDFEKMQTNLQIQNEKWIQEKTKEFDLLKKSLEQ
ncbi:MAG: hypothetical protein WC878_02900 [Candidatus Paceibacterota bacterium]|jgi:hypothetical protein